MRRRELPRAPCEVPLAHWEVPACPKEALFLPTKSLLPLEESPLGSDNNPPHVIQETLTTKRMERSAQKAVEDVPYPRKS